MSDTTILWTRQVPQVWDEIQKNGVYRVKEEYIRIKNDTIADYYLDLYRWYTREARKHLTFSEELEYPVWLCVDEEFMLQPVDDCVIFKLEVPNDQFLICNMDAWGYRVNYWYIPLNEEDRKKHEAELKRYGLASEDELISTSKGNFYPLLKRKVIDSWSRVFTLPPEKKESKVATTWEIRKEWVREVRVYEKQPDDEE